MQNTSRVEQASSLKHMWPRKTCDPTFAGLAVTSATVVMYGAPITDPVQLLGKIEGVVPICISLFGELVKSVNTL